MKRVSSRKICMAVLLIFFLQFFTFASPIVFEVEASSSPTIDYVYTEGTSTPYDVMYDYIGNLGASVSIVQTNEAYASTGYANQRKLVHMSNGTIYNVYVAIGLEIYIKKSNDDGVTWIDATHLCTLGAMTGKAQTHPAIAVDSNDSLHVVWQGLVNSDSRIYYTKYINYTFGWSDPIYISTYSGMTSYDQYRPSIAVDSNDYLHVVWQGKATGFTTDYQIWYRSYTTSWGTVTRISTHTDMEDYGQYTPIIAVDGNDYLHVLWAGKMFGFTAKYQIWYRSYTMSWGTITRISDGGGMASYDQFSPCIAIDSDDYLHVVWQGRGDGFTTNTQIYYRSYTTSWGTITRISTYAGMNGYNQQDPSIAVDTDEDIHVLWEGKATGFSDFDKVWYATYETSWVAPTCLHPIGQNKYPNLCWSRWPEIPLPLSGTSVTIDNMEGCGDWVFAEERYYEFNATYTALDGWENLDICKLRFTDGYNTIITVYDISDEEFSIEDGSDTINLKAGTVKNLSSAILSVTFEIYFKNTILDAYNVNIDLRTLNATEDSGWSEEATDYFNIYCLGGKADITTTGSAGRITGGDVFELYAGGTTYTAADIFDDDFESQELFYPWTLWEYTDENPANDISVVNYPTRSGGGRYVAKIHDAAAGVPNPELELYFNEQTSDFAIQMYARVNDNTAGWSVIQIEDKLGSSVGHIAVVRFGYTTDYDWFYVDDGGATANISVPISADTWYNITFTLDFANDLYDVWIDSVLVADDYDWVNADYEPGYLTIDARHSGVARSTFVDDVKIWRDWSGGTGGTVTSSVSYRKFQHLHALFGFSTEAEAITWDLWNQDRNYKQGYVEFGINVCKADEWFEQWKIRFEIYDGQIDGRNSWVELNASWYDRGTWVDSDILYAYWEGYEYGGAKQFRLFIDLWFNKVNASSTIGGRLNTEYFGVHDSSIPIINLIFGRDWGPMIEEVSQSMFFADLKNPSGNIYSSKEIEMMKVWARVNRGNNYDYQYALTDFDLFDLERVTGGRPMVGIDTPIFVETKMRDMPSFGFLAALGTIIRGGFEALMAAITSDSVSAWYELVGFLDTVGSWLGFPNIFSDMSSWIASGFQWMLDSFVMLYLFLTDMFTVATNISTEFFTFTTILVTNWVLLWNTFWNIMRDAYNTGFSFTRDLNILMWLQIAAIIYPLHLFVMWEVKGWGPVQAEIEFIINIAHFIVNILVTVVTLIINLISTLIESIPIIEMIIPPLIILSLRPYLVQIIAVVI